MTVRWVKDPKVEHNLRQLGIKFESEHVAIADIDLQLSTDRQVRLGKKTDDNKVLEYAQRMLDDAPFDMCLLNKLKKGYFVWSGVHRVHASVLTEETHIDAYVVQVSDVRLSDILARVVNVWDDKISYGREERLIHAQYMVHHHGLLVPDAAKLMGLKAEWLNQFLRQSEVASKIEAQGVSVNGIARSTLKAMGPLADNANILRETTKLIHKHKLAGNRAIQVIEDVRRGETEAQRIVELERWEKILTPAARKPKVKVPYTQKRRDRCLELLGRMKRFIDGVDSLTQLQIVESEDVKTVKSLWSGISGQWDKIMKGV
jgi:hypothetical protein